MGNVVSQNLPRDYQELPYYFGVYASDAKSEESEVKAHEGYKWQELLALTHRPFVLRISNFLPNSAFRDFLNENHLEGFDPLVNQLIESDLDGDQILTRSEILSYHQSHLNSLTPVEVFFYGALLVRYADEVLYRQNYKEENSKLEDALFYYAVGHETHKPEDSYDGNEFSIGAITYQNPNSEQRIIDQDQTQIMDELIARFSKEDSEVYRSLRAEAYRVLEGLQGDQSGWRRNLNSRAPLLAAQINSIVRVLGDIEDDSYQLGGLKLVSREDSEVDRLVKRRGKIIEDIWGATNLSPEQRLRKVGLAFVENGIDQAFLDQIVIEDMVVVIKDLLAKPHVGVEVLLPSERPDFFNFYQDQLDTISLASELAEMQDGYRRDIIANGAETLEFLDENSGLITFLILNLMAIYGVSSLVRRNMFRRFFPDCGPDDLRIIQEDYVQWNRTQSILNNRKFNMAIGSILLALIIRYRGSDTAMTLTFAQAALLIREVYRFMKPDIQNYMQQRQEYIQSICQPQPVPELVPAPVRVPERSPAVERRRLPEWTYEPIGTPELAFRDMMRQHRRRVPIPIEHLPQNISIWEDKGLWIAAGILVVGLGGGAILLGAGAVEGGGAILIPVFL